jgi:hypothetical protein
MAYIGSQRLTADGVVGISGHPVRVHSVVMLSGGGGAGELVLRDGTSASGTTYVIEAGTAASKTKTYNFEGGVYFPSGCFFDIDTNTAAVVVNYEQVA